MILFRNERKESDENLERGKAHLEMEMKLKFDECIRAERSTERTETEMEKEIGYKSQDLDEKGSERVKNGVCDGEDESKADVSRGEEINNQRIVGGYNKEIPAADDVCPICFDMFTVPCRSNCGHWFCASCFLQFWMYRSSVQPCKCPLCCCLIFSLKPQTSFISFLEPDTVGVLKKVEQYNGLHAGGVHGTFLKILALPLLMRKILRVLTDPDNVRCVYYAMRLLGLFLALLYETWEFEFIPTGGLGIQRMFDMSASVLVISLFLIGVGNRCLLRFRAWRLAGLRPWDT